jgi:SAP domain-containing ribonucleoprotein
MAPAGEYSRKKNDELQELLKARGLPHAGKKADMIARLEAHDAEQSAAKPSAPEESEATASSEPAAAAVAAGGKGQPANPLAVPNQVAGEDPSKGGDLKVKEPETATGEDSKEDAGGAKTEGEGTETAPEKKDFSSNIPTVSVDDELEKRRKRAERFGTKLADSQSAGATSESTKALERQKRFGASAASSGSAVDSLNRALPERERKRTRGGDGAGGDERSGKRRDSRRRDGRGGQQNKGTGEKGKKQSNESGEKDKQAAEARKKRFAKAS